MNTTAWTSESSAAKQHLATAVTVIAGAALAIGFRQFEGPALSGSRAGFWLGVVLLVVGVGMFFFGGKQIITVEPKRQRIVITRQGRVRSHTQHIHFNDIAGVSVAESGDTEGGSVRFHVAVTLKTGKSVALFLGFFEGSHSRQAMEARCQRLVECMQPAG